MDKLVGNALGSDGIAAIAGQKAGDLVEGAVKNALGGKTKKEAQKGGGFNPGDLLSLGGGNKADSKGGIDPSDVLSLVGGGGKSEGKGEGFDVKDALGGIFK